MPQQNSASASTVRTGDHDASMKVALGYAHWMAFGKRDNVAPEDLAGADGSRFEAADVMAWELKAHQDYVAVKPSDGAKATAKAPTKARGAKATAKITSFVVARP